MDIPVPRVLAWDGRSSNSAESEYILMEEAKGQQLEELWADMDLDCKFGVVDDVITIQEKLQSVTFSRSGGPSSMLEYLANSAGSDTATSISNQMHSKVAPESKYLATYHTRPRHMQRIGSDAHSYLGAISRRERSKLPQSKTSKTYHSSQNELDVLKSPQARISLLDKFDALSPYLPPSDPSLDKATLSHWDLRAPNLFVEGDRITSLIDWQDAWVGPLFMQERRPQLIEYNGEEMLRLPDYYEAMDDKDEKARLTDKVEKSILYWYYGRETQKRNPVLQQLFDLPMARTRREVVLFASEVWDGDTIPLRECLYQLQQSVSFPEAFVEHLSMADNCIRHWDKLDTGVPCPISFPSKEIDLHNRNAAGWNETADFWSSLSGFVSRDGYTSIEHYEDARKMFEELREQGLAHLSGRELADFAEQSQWAKRAD
nr:hypothetical protein CFP56_16593 [Quercus suber]